MIRLEVLDKGYIELVERWGTDSRIIESARMSTGKGFIAWGPIHATNCARHPDFLRHVMPEQGDQVECTCESKPGDEKLLRHLYTKGHTTPFEMCGATFEIKAPIFVFREWHRHRTQSYNEFSARYSELPNEFYIPSLERLKHSKQSVTNKQSSQEGFDERDATVITESLLSVYNIARKHYDWLLKQGVAKEIARLVIPVSQYSKMRASANLLNWLKFLRLRMPDDAQFEIRQYAHAMREILIHHYPETMKLFDEEYNARHATKI